VAYFADTYARQVLRFALDGAGVPQGKTVFAGIAAEEGYPDGMTVDAQGTLYVGHWDGARISRWLPDGTRRPDLTVAARNVTSLAFGGPQLGTALVTTAMLFPGQPEATEGERNGDLFSFEAAVPGLEEPELARDWAPKRPETRRRADPPSGHARTGRMPVAGVAGGGALFPAALKVPVDPKPKSP
jgi:sugar lactone lactonase YvrE